jgi:hypothetical protein
VNNLNARVKRLESAVARRGEQHQKTRWERVCHALDDQMALDAWLEERGYVDHLAAVEVGETGPEGLEDLLREQAGYDAKYRASARIEKALNAGELPDEAASLNGSLKEAFKRDRLGRRQ